MPVLGYRRYGAYGSLDPPPAPPLPVKIVNIKISSSYDHIIGRLNLVSMHRSYDYIKICLKLILKLDGENTACSETDLFQHFASIETELFPCKLILFTTHLSKFKMNLWVKSICEARGRRRLDFILNIPKDRIYPPPFASSIGSLCYKLVALMTNDETESWEPLTSTLLFDFKGYCNTSDLECVPTVDVKKFLDEKITSIFTLNEPVLIVGRDTNVSAILELISVQSFNVNATVTFLRTTKFGKIVRTEIISLQKQVADSHESNTSLTWNFDVLPSVTPTYTNEHTPAYSVRYFMKYDATFKLLVDENSELVVDGNGCGHVEVKVGTRCDSFTASDSPSGSEAAKIVDDLEKLTLTARCNSVTSVLTLPPAYSQLSSRAGSVLSIEIRIFGFLLP